MANTSDYELWNEFELDGETDQENWQEFAYETDPETDPEFIPWIKKQGTQFWQQNPWFRRIARDTASAAVGSACTEAQRGLARARARANHICQKAQGRIRQWESEPEWQPEADQEVQLEAIMQQLGNQAAKAQTEEEALAFLAPLAGMALKRFAPKLAGKAAGILGGGIRSIGQRLLRNRGGRNLMGAVPQIASRTARSLGQGGPVTPSRVRGTLARVAHGTLQDPRRAMAAMRRRRPGYGQDWGGWAPPPSHEPPPMDDFPLDDMPMYDPPMADFGPDGGDSDFSGDEEVTACPTCAKCKK